MARGQAEAGSTKRFMLPMLALERAAAVHRARNELQVAALGELGSIAVVPQRIARSRRVRSRFTTPTRHRSCLLEADSIMPAFPCAWRNHAEAVRLSF